MLLPAHAAKELENEEKKAKRIRTSVKMLSSKTMTATASKIAEIVKRRMK